MNLTRLLGAVGFCLLTTSPVSHGALIGTTHFVYDDGGFVENPDKILYFEISICGPIPGYIPVCYLQSVTNPGVILDTTLTSSDDGRVFIFDETSSEFNDVVNLLTNGINDHTDVGFNDVPFDQGGSSHSGDSEAHWFYGDGTGANGIDFAGYQIDYLEVVIDSVRVGSQPFQKAVYFDLNVYGSPVPIPPAIWLFGSGLLGLIGIARRKKAA